MVSVIQGSALEKVSSSHQAATPGAGQFTVTVAGDEGSVRLDRVLAVRVPELSRSRLKALILAGSVRVGTAPVRDPAYHAASGDTITIDVPETVPAEPGPENIALDIVYEDDDIVVIDKPKGLVVHPAAGHETGTLVNALIAHCGASLSGIGGVRRPGIVHRLDKDTTGLMVVAKNDLAHRSLSAQFADHGRTGAMERGYMAFAWGVGPAARYGRCADRPSSARPASGGAWTAAALRSRTGRSGRFSRAATARPLATLLACPPRDRPHPPDQGSSRPYRPPPDGRCRLRSAFQDQGWSSRVREARRRLSRSEARLQHPCWYWSTRRPEKFCAGNPGLPEDFSSPAQTA